MLSTVKVRKYNCYIVKRVSHTAPK